MGSEFPEAVPGVDRATQASSLGYLVLAALCRESGKKEFTLPHTEGKNPF